MLASALASSSPGMGHPGGRSCAPAPPVPAPEGSPSSKNPPPAAPPAEPPAEPPAAPPAASLLEPGNGPLNDEGLCPPGAYGGGGARDAYMVRLLERLPGKGNSMVSRCCLEGVQAVSLFRMYELLKEVSSLTRSYCEIPDDTREKLAGVVLRRLARYAHTSLFAVATVSKFHSLEKHLLLFSVVFSKPCHPIYIPRDGLLSMAFVEIYVRSVLIQLSSTEPQKESVDEANRQLATCRALVGRLINDEVMPAISTDSSRLLDSILCIASQIAMFEDAAVRYAPRSDEEADQVWNYFKTVLADKYAGEAAADSFLEFTHKHKPIVCVRLSLSTEQRIILIPLNPKPPKKTKVHERCGHFQTHKRLGQCLGALDGTAPRCRRDQRRRKHGHGARQNSPRCVANARL